MGISYRDFLSRILPVAGLDIGDFPPEAIVTRNFHCGFYSDSDILEGILHFQRDSMDSYLEWINNNFPAWRRIVVRMGSQRVVRYMLKHSEPLIALLNGDESMIRHYFHRPPALNPAHSGW